ncbi:hypothetical protein NL676_025648 [Syzygium grande]|nr:hypothetical protein NL676_025648 [Syzygium grande]
MDSYGDGYEIMLSESPLTVIAIAQWSQKLNRMTTVYARLKNTEEWKKVTDRGTNNGGNTVVLFAVHLAVLLAVAALTVRLASHCKYLKIRVISLRVKSTGIESSGFAWALRVSLWRL